MFKKNISIFLLKFPYISCLILSFFIKRHKSEKRHSVRIFVLDEFRFREDINILKEMTDIEYINFPNILQDKINGIILHSGTNNNKHLSKFIKYFCNMYKSSGFMSAGMYYRRHELWEIAALSANKSFFCLHREGVGVDYNSLKNNFQQLFNSARKFKGTMLFVATHSLKKFLVDNNYMFLTEPTESNVAKTIIKAIHTEPKISQLQLLDYLHNFTWKEYCRNILKTILQ